MNDGVKPPRPALEQERGQGEELDAALLRNFVRRVGLSVEDVGHLTKDEAGQLREARARADDLGELVVIAGADERL